MIDWHLRCIELARIVDRHHRERMLKDKKLAWNMASELIELDKKMNKDALGKQEWLPDMQPKG